MNGGARPVVGLRRPRPEAPGARREGRRAGRPTPTARATRDEYGRVRCRSTTTGAHAARLVGSWRIDPKWELGGDAARLLGLPAHAGRSGCASRPTRRRDGRSCRPSTPEGRYVYETTLGGVSNLNSARLPAFFRLDLRLSWKPRGDAGRWLALPRRDQRDEPQERRPDRRRGSPTTRARRSTSRGSSSRPRRSRSCRRSAYDSASERPPEPFVPFGAAHVARARVRRRRSRILARRAGPGAAPAAPPRAGDARGGDRRRSRPSSSRRPRARAGSAGRPSCRSSCATRRWCSSSPRSLVPRAGDGGDRLLLGRLRGRCSRC